MAVIRSFRDLEVYQKSLAEARSIFEISKRFPKEETYALTDQIRRASRAVGAMIAEAWGRRRYIAAFVNKLSEAMAEGMETQAWLDHALRCQYIRQEEHDAHDREWERIGGMLNRMQQRASNFCRPR